MISRPHHDPVNYPISATKMVWGGPMVDIINPKNFGVNRSIGARTATSSNFGLPL